MKRYGWARPGDINAFFGLMLDNAAVMVLLVSLVSKHGAAEGSGYFTSQFVLTHMIPGTALGVLLGDLVYTWMAFRLARRTQRDDVTAMPLGLDTPSTFPVAFLILLPALKEGADLFPGDYDQAMDFAWHVGLSVLVMVGIFKVALAPMGNAVRRLVPRAGLLGSLAAVALVLIAFLPLMDIAAVPAAGLAALAIILISLVAHRELPGKVPGALAAVLVGVVVYQIGLWLQPAPIKPEAGEKLKLGFDLALPSLFGQSAAFWEAVLKAALAKLPVILPFALATIVGGIDCTESAASAGDEYDTRAVLLTEGVASLAAGLFGGVLQTTPYIGQPAYKKMGGRAAYTFANALFIGLAGCCGFGLLFESLPKAAMFPILVFVGLEITAQSFHATPVKHYPAVAIAMLPALAQLAMILMKDFYGGATPTGQEALAKMQTMRCLANGFIVTSMIWAAALAMLLDGRQKAAAICFTVAAVCALVGIMHSPLPDEQIALPHMVMAEMQELAAKSSNPRAVLDAVRLQTPYHWAAGYALMALITLGLALPSSGVSQSEPGRIR